MRISTSTIFDNATSQLGTLQSSLARTQMQLSTQRRMLTPADDPVASARALEVTQSQSMNAQFATNRQNARSSLASVEQAVTDATDLLLDVQTLVVQAGNGALSPNDRGMVATEIEGRLHDLLGVANSTDGTGNYLFSGYLTNTVPFLAVPGGAKYQGDQGQRVLQVGSARHMAISDTGNDVFENILTGNGTFDAQPNSANAGTGVVSNTAVVDRSQLDGHAFELAFQVSGTPAVTTYTVKDTSTAPPTALSSGPYVSGQQIAFKGMALAIKGDPADGDKFSVAPSQNQSLFATITSLIAVVRGPSGTEPEKAVMSNGLNSAGANLQQALDKLLTVRATVGSRMKELDYLDGSGDDLDLQYASTLSDLQDLDVVKAMSTFSQQQLALEAAQKSFKSMSSLSLFNYIG